MSQAAGQVVEPLSADQNVAFRGFVEKSASLVRGFIVRWWIPTRSIGLRANSPSRQATHNILHRQQSRVRDELCITKQQPDDASAYHIINGTATYSNLSTNGSTFKPLQGTPITITALNDTLYINNAKSIWTDSLVSNIVTQVLDSFQNPNNTSIRPSHPPFSTYSSTTSDSGLSSCARAGIAIAAIFIALLLVATALWFSRRRNSARWREAARCNARLVSCSPLGRGGGVHAIHDEPGVGLDELPGRTQLVMGMEDEGWAVELKYRNW